jgi:DNA replication protein DnaC
MQFEQVVYIRPDGTEIPPDARCDRCSRVEELRIRHEEQSRELAATAAAQRDYWRLTLRAEMGDELATKTFEGFNRKLQPAAFRAITDWPGSGGSIVLQSPPGVYGVGKSHLVAALANHLTETMNAAVSVQGAVVRLPRPAVFCTEPELLGRIRATFADHAPETDEQIYLELERVRLLIVDDVGKRAARDLTFTQQVWYRIIDGRYRAQRPIILTTNMELDELGEHIGGAAADRLRGMCGRKGFITMTGESQRRVR